MLSNTEIYYRRSPGLDHPACDYPGFQPGTTIWKKGSVFKEGHYPLPCDIRFDRDVAIPMRDGIILYADIFRPVGDEKVPAILCSTTFGKAKIGKVNKQMPTICMPGEEVPGLMKSDTSGMNTFEGADPGYFVEKGYAVVNLDIRGAYMSEGKSPYFGTQETQDDYDAVEWLAAQEWCSGKVAMAGNSWLAIVQWFTAAMQPPHLTCIAPWEGWQDMYRDEYMIGGIANFPGFRDINVFKDDGEMEDVIANIVAHPLFDEYWEDKVAHAERIQVPTYVTASWSSPVHCQGTWRAWRMIPTQEKWMRLHNKQEWKDTEEHNDELLLFFDHYLKGIDNGWEKTPKIRIAVLDNGHEDILNKEISAFPMKEEKLTTLYLNTEDMRMHPELPAEETFCKYNSYDGKSMVKFNYTFEKDTQVIGYIGMKLWVSVDCYDDLDLFIRCIKLDSDGNDTHHWQIPGNRLYSPDGYMGPVTRQRASLRKVDPAKGTKNEPFHPFDEIQKLKPFEIVPLEVGLFPTGIYFHAGETLQLQIAGYSFYQLPSSHLMDRNKIGIDNNGYHFIHSGGQFDSQIHIPMLDAKI